MEKVILASTSPRRQMLMEQTNIAFVAVDPDFAETMDDSMNAADLACSLALGKARSVASAHPGEVVVAGDTFVVFKGRFYSKLESEGMARELLTELSGNVCSIVSGFAVVQNDREYSRAIETFAFIKPLSTEEIGAYLGSGEWVDKAAGVSISIVDRIEGDTSAALGLPIRELLTVLKSFGVEPTAS